MSVKPALLQVAPLSPGCEARLADEYVVQRWITPEERAVAPRDGPALLVTTAPVGAHVQLMDRVPTLKAIVCRGVGVDAIDLDAARRRGIAVSTTPGVLDGCVADAALGALLAVARGLVTADRFVRRGDWVRGRFPAATRVHGKRLGIVGLGAIGQQIARRAAGFDLDIRYHNRRPAAVAWPYEPDLLALARWADFLVLSCSGGPASHHLVDARVLDALGAQGFLVNVARGSVVDEKALIAALATRSIAGAALDVYADEPRVPAALLALDNVVLLPHLASNSRETFAAMEQAVLDNIASWFAHGRLLTPVA